MNIIIYLVVAAVIGWVASVIMKDRASIFINIIVAIVGAFLAGWFISPLLKIGTINDAITLPTMLVTLLGAVILIGIVHLLRRRILNSTSRIDESDPNWQGWAIAPLPGFKFRINELYWYEFEVINL